jgi:heat shock protein HslJ
MRTRIPTPALLALAAALLLGGCAAGPATDDGTDAPMTNSLTGEWQLTKAGDAAGALSFDAVPVTLAISDTTVAGQGPCNSYTGSVTVDSDAVAFSPLSHTELACADPARNDLEARYFAALELVRGSSRTGDTLTLSGGDVTLQYTLLEKKKIVGGVSTR